MSKESVLAATEFIVFGKPQICKPEMEEVVDSLRSGWLGTGPKVKAFERAVAEYVGVDHAVAANSCTAALHLSLVALGVGAGDEVIVPSLTFCATANVVIHAGATPVLVDSDPDSQCVSVAEVEAAITPRTKAIIPVHFAGWPAAMEELRAVADRHGLKIVQDSAHCLEGWIDGQSPARHGDVTCYSFYPTKNVVTGEGGMAVTNDPDLAHRMRVLGLHGLDADAWKRFSDEGFKHYECVVPGFKYNMIDLQAALGLHQLARVEANLVTRNEQWDRYSEALADLPLDLPASPPAGIRHARHLYTVLVQRDARLSRDELARGLHERGVGTGVHYRPVHEQAYYREQFDYEPDRFPVAGDIGARTLSVPLGPSMSLEQQNRVIDALMGLLV